MLWYSLEASQGGAPASNEHIHHTFSWRIKKYSWLSLSRPRLSRITAYLEVKIWSLPKHQKLTICKKYCGKEEKLLRSNFFFFPQYFQYVSLTSRVQLHIYLLNVVNRISFSSILQIWYVEVRISRSISECPLEFEITRVDCILSGYTRLSGGMGDDCESLFITVCYLSWICFWLSVLWFNDTSTFVGHFLSSSREREKRDSSRDERERQGRKRKMNESEYTKETKTSPAPTHTCCKDSRFCPTISQYHLDALVTQDTRHFCLTQPPPEYTLFQCLEFQSLAHCVQFTADEILKYCSYFFSPEICLKCQVNNLNIC